MTALTKEETIVAARLLREIGAMLDNQRSTLRAIGEKVDAIVRQAAEVKALTATAHGRFPWVEPVYATTGQRLGRLEEQVAGLRARVGELERRG
ncbi:MAG: hypothetical protein U1E40_00270 [Amaricoccus sp.]